MSYDCAMRSVVLAFAGGILCLQTQSDLAGWAGAGLLALPLLWIGCRHDRSRSSSAMVLAFFLLGFAWAGGRAEWRLTDALPGEWEGRDIEVIGVVAALPQVFAQGSRFEFDVEQVLTPHAVVPQRVMLSWYRGLRDTDPVPLSEILPGERRQLTVRLKRPHGNANPLAFDYEAWLLERNLRASGYVRAAERPPLAAMVWQADYGVERLRHAVRASMAHLLPVERYPWAGVLIALVIGDQRAIQGDLWNIFNRTGTTHLMSISGLHVTMVAALFGGLVSFAWRRLPWLVLRWPAQRAAVLAGFLAAFAYTLLAGFAVPAQRTLYMLGVAALAMSSGRSPAPSRTLCLALAVVLLIDPWAVLAAGFWLSFGAVGALLYIGSGLVGKTPGWRGSVAAWGAVQWAATLASLPVLLLVFQQFSLVSPLANALAIPVISFIVTPLALLGAVLPWWPIPALAHWAMDMLMVFLNWCAIWPVWQAAAPPLWSAALGAIGVLCCLLPRGVPGRWLGSLLLLPLLFWPAARPAENEAWITVLDVGQGLSAVVQTHRHTLVYDPGPLYSAEANAGQRVVVPYLRAIGLDRLDEMMITHRDSDHSGGTASLKAALPIARIRSSLGELAGLRCLAGQQWNWDGVAFTVLHPAEEDYRNPAKANNLSCVLRVEAAGRRMLLTADIEARDEAALLERAGLKADVLLVPHHGSRTSSTPAFLDAVQAREAVVPVGYRNRFGHPKGDVMERYGQRQIRPWRTDQQGAITVRLASGGVSLSAWREAHQRYWHGR